MAVEQHNVRMTRSLNFPNLLSSWSSELPGTVLGDRGKLGAFVETKNAVIGAGTKVPHLTYVGDADGPDLEDLTIESAPLLAKGRISLTKQNWAGKTP